MRDELLTVGALARETQVSPKTLRRWVRDGHLTATRDTANRRLFYRQEAIKEVGAMLKRNARWYRHLQGPESAQA
jgi:excisionase family DNA binding protein